MFELYSMTKIGWNPNWFRVVLCLSCFSKRRRTWWGAKFPEYTFPLEREIEPLSFIMESLWKNFETGNRDSRTADLVRISKKGMQGPTNGRIDPNLKRGSKNPWRAESVQIMKGGLQGSTDRRFGPNFQRGMQGSTDGPVGQNFFELDLLLPKHQVTLKI